MRPVCTEAGIKYDGWRTVAHLALENIDGAAGAQSGSFLPEMEAAVVETVCQEKEERLICRTSIIRTALTRVALIASSSP